MPLIKLEDHQKALVLKEDVKIHQLGLLMSKKLLEPILMDGLYKLQMNMLNYHQLLLLEKNSTYLKLLLILIPIKLLLLLSLKIHGNYQIHKILDSLLLQPLILPLNQPADNVSLSMELKLTKKLSHSQLMIHHSVDKLMKKLTNQL